MAEPLLLDQFMPRYDHAIVYSQVFRAPPQDCFEALVSMDILQIPVIRLAAEHPQSPRCECIMATA